MPKVSVIVPIYNVEEYLGNCIDSIIHQTLSDIEIILVDDGSSDNSGKICDEYELKDNRIRVIHKANGGLSSARNAGIAVALSPFVMFIDSDDWVDPEYCEQPYMNAINHNADLVLFSYKIIREDGTVDIKNIGMTDRLLNKSEAFDFNVNFAQAAWLGLYRKQLFDSIQFPIGMLLEDVATTYKLIHTAENIYLLDLPLYNYRVGRPGSIMTEQSSKRYQDLKEIWTFEIYDFFDWGYDEYAVSIAITLLAWYGCASFENTELIKKVRRCKPKTLSNLNWRKKMMFIVLKISPTLFDAFSVFTGRRGK